MAEAKLDAVTEQQTQLNDLANRISRSTIGQLRDQCVQAIQVAEQLQQEEALNS